MGIYQNSIFEIVRSSISIEEKPDDVFEQTRHASSDSFLHVVPKPQEV